LYEFAEGVPAKEVVNEAVVAAASVPAAPASSIDVKALANSNSGKQYRLFGFAIGSFSF
jgi:ribosomal protein L12E/L44/L45/RPP1/RPP2